jgi:hypothetical protein
MGLNWVEKSKTGSFEKNGKKNVPILFNCDFYVWFYTFKIFLNYNLFAISDPLNFNYARPSQWTTIKPP